MLKVFTMDTVKEFKVRDKICCGCLSLNRKTFVMDKPDLFVMLLTNQTGYTESKYLNIIRLCWECKAIMQRIIQFQQKITEAHFILEKALELGQIHTQISSLSHLKMFHKTGYDCTIDYEEELLKTNFSETVPLQNCETVLLQNCEAVIKTEINDDNDMYYDVKEEHLSDRDDSPKMEKVVKSKRRKGIPFVKKATISKNDIDLNDPEKYYERVVLSNDEMGEVLKREREDKNDKSSYRLPCTFCEVKFKRGIDMRRHVDQVHVELKPSPLDCSKCHVPFPTQLELQQHWTSHNVLYKCMYCAEYVRTNVEMNAHMTGIHSKIYTCKVCGIWIYSTRQFTAHHRTMHSQCVCDDCGRVFGFKKNLERHMVRHHLPAICRLCNKQFPKYHGLEVHNRHFHPELVYAGVKQEQSYCVECDRQFASQYMYKRHLHTAVAHAPRKPQQVPCPECGKVFSRNTYMKNHFKLIHVQASKHYCEKCNKQFVSGFSLRTHIKFVHEKTAKPKDKMCDVCGRGFHTNRTLSNHKRTHTGERPYKCTYCPAAFAQSYARTTHERSQHKNLAEYNILPTYMDFYLNIPIYASRYY